MAHKKDAENHQSAEDEALHKRVYEMMELDRSKNLKAGIGAPAEPIDIFKDSRVKIPELVEPIQETKTASVKSIKLDDEATDKVIDEILVSEGDALLAAEDAAAQFKKLVDKPKTKKKLSDLFG